MFYDTFWINFLLRCEVRVEVLHKDNQSSQNFLLKRLWEVPKGPAGQWRAWQEHNGRSQTRGQKERRVDGPLGAGTRREHHWSQVNAQQRTSPEHPSRQNGQLACHHHLSTDSGCVQTASTVVGEGCTWAQQCGLLLSKASLPAATPPLTRSTRHFGAPTGPIPLWRRLASSFIFPSHSPVDSTSIFRQQTQS